MSIVFGAQACGFGPVSKVVSLASTFNNSDKVFIGNKIALQFVEKQRDIFQNVLNSESYTDKPSQQEIREASYGVIVMDHNLAFQFFLNNKRFYFIDSLFGFWYSRKKEKTLAAIFSEICKMRKLDKIKAYANLKVHEQKLLAHYVSEMSFVQNFFGVRERVERLNKLGFTHINLTNPIIINKNTTYQAQTNGEMLINLGGIENFLIESQNGAYLLLIEKLAKDIINHPKITKITVCAGSYIKPKEEKCGEKKILYCFANKTEFHQLLISSQYYLTSPGMTAFYESLYYQRPTIFIPEQHASQFYNLNKIKATWMKPYCISLFNIVGKRYISPNDFRGSSQIVAYISKILRNKKLYDILLTQVIRQLDVISDIQLKKYQQNCNSMIKSLQVTIQITDIDKIIYGHEQSYG